MHAKHQPSPDAPGQQSIDARFICCAFPSATAIKALTPEEAGLVARRMLGSARGAKEIDREMRKRGLLPMAARARAYSPFSKSRASLKLVAIVPYNSTDADSDCVGGVGLSEGEPASGVVVDMRAGLIETVTTIDFIGGKIVERKISARELAQQGPRRFPEDEKFKRESLTPDIPVDTSTGMAADAFKVLLFDDHSSMVHSQADIRKMIHQAPLVSAIAELQYVRLQGLAMSPGESCCCCCCCCWGSCSSCSATSTKYVNQVYQERWQA
jgi:hypothetical protein